MGSLSGHIVPGTFFLIFGVWWAWSVFHKYFMWMKFVKSEEDFDLRQKKKYLKYRNTVTFPCISCHRIPTEGIIKLLLTSIGMIGEFVTAFKNGKFTHYGNVQHITMYFFFGLSGVTDILTFYNQSLIPDMDYVTGTLAYLMEGILFLYHLDGMNGMEFRVHILLIYLIFATAISCMGEMVFRNSIWPSLCRVFFTLLQGTWFWQVGFILYIYDWDPLSHNRMKTVTFVYTWHFAGVFLFLLSFGYLIQWRVTHLRKENVFNRSLYMLHNSRKGYFFREGECYENTITFSDSDEL